MTPGIYAYIFTMAAVTYLIRVLPLTLFRKEVNNQFVKSFLYYVPYATLAAMTFPTIIHATQSPISGIAALIVGFVTAWFGFDIFRVAFSCCGVVLLLEFFIR
ncbi:MAG: AzlD domain-containing protein [Ruminococcaceae bacterium]|nr:AzlD domain-containing protein [Oscillospiraceae bacterium]